MNVEDRIPGLQEHETTTTYVMWHRDELELRSFLLTSCTGMKAWFKDQENDAEAAVREKFDPENSYGDEGYSLFMDRVGIFWEQYWYQLAAAVIKDAFTLYEVFLEEAAHELLLRHGSGLINLSTERTWLLDQCNDFYRDYLGFHIKQPEIEHIQWIRNKLSHLRDSLRTAEGKAEFEERIKSLGIGGDPSDDEREFDLPHYDYGRDLAFARSLTLSPLEAWRILDLLRRNIEELTKVLNVILYGQRTTVALYNLSNGTVVRDRDKRFLRIPT